MALISPSDLTRYIDVSETSPGVWAPEIATSIAKAQEAINAFTAQIWSQDSVQPGARVYVETNRAGEADLPYYLYAETDLDEVYDATARATLDAASYAVELGQRVSRISLYATGGWNLRVVGSEPWNTNTAERAVRLRLTATWGYPDAAAASSPLAIREALSLLAASYLVADGYINPITSLPYVLTESGANVLSSTTDPAVAAISVEGYSVTYRDPQAAGGAPVATTGYSAIDTLLTPYRQTARARWF